ncbi:hypothetical protein M758_5G083500 [Ceratodon purpureus]|nr:hypothetical protein M758_5G083500 [Ceratodon purpureus]
MNCEVGQWQERFYLPELTIVLSRVPQSGKRVESYIRCATEQAAFLQSISGGAFKLYSSRLLENVMLMEFDHKATRLQVLRNNILFRFKCSTYDTRP